jgi:hypothetical protein
VTFWRWVALAGGVLGWVLVGLMAWSTGGVVRESTQPVGVRYDTDPAVSPYRLVIRKGDLECCYLMPPLVRRYEIYLGLDESGDGYGVYLDLPDVPLGNVDEFFAAVKVRWSRDGVRLVPPRGRYELFVPAEVFTGGR